MAAYYVGKADGIVRLVTADGRVVAAYHPIRGWIKEVGFRSEKCKKISPEEVQKLVGPQVFEFLENYRSAIT